MSENTTALITGASTGIGAAYADRFARRGHNLVLVARNQERLEGVASRLRVETGVSVDIVRADLTDTDDLAVVETRLRDDDRIGILVNNAGFSLPGGFLQQSPGDVARLIALNATAVARLTSAVAPRFADAGSGAIVNISSVVGLAPEFGMSVYGATKAFVTYLSQGLSLELGPKGVYVQAVLPAATRTELWDLAGIDVNTLTGVMEVDDLVDAALVGFDRREAVTIPPLHEAARWDAHQAARQAILPDIAQSKPGERYLAKA
ncbi:SDR family oxidoreductase [Agrobacterium tumefaciens]|uniref:SDR family NAD(P)-dependent oxidoreductase n=1 Tax=Agrobacterium tumefaciens TaxID=358 RepID=UPI001573DEE3|nr:SDR family oxidoreductase [Agrobacterium tumefaciens]MCZ7497343.1 SDR family oxidoreductase [Rhizobium rhizogenes]NTE56557.1 SDR family oxidoreductase [Agrobacterium tumefaciens]NTE74525.1 SDR family oxidoreductase [Agrobacterium tumefaciens]